MVKHTHIVSACPVVQFCVQWDKMTLFLALLLFAPAQHKDVDVKCSATECIATLPNPAKHDETVWLTMDVKNMSGKPIQQRIPIYISKGQRDGLTPLIAGHSLASYELGRPVKKTRR